MPVRSEPGRAHTTAIRYFPAPRRHALFSDGRKLGRQPEPRRQTGAAFNGVTVLIVEDEQLVAQATFMLLRRAGYQPVGTAASGEEGVRLALLHRPDVVLMDVRLQDPQPDGIHAAEEIRNEHDCILVFVTAHRDPDTVARSAAVEPDGFLTKPYSGEQLFEIIKRAATRKRRQRDASEDDPGPNPEGEE